MGIAVRAASVHDHPDVPASAETRRVVPRPAGPPVATLTAADSDLVLGILRRMREAQRETVADPG